MIEKSKIAKEKESVWRRVFVIIIAITLLLLTTSYILLGYPIFPILESISESKLAENKTIWLENISIIFTEDTYEKLQDYYNENLSVEMVVCLKGTIKENYVINEIYQPEIIERSFNHVSFMPCSGDTIILLHSHPFRRCIASQQDLITLATIKERNHNSLMVIMCESNRFSVYE
jgi:hypothetical protein